MKKIILTTLAVFISLINTTLAAPTPNVSLTSTTQELFSEPIQLNLSFNNSSGVSTETGFFPQIEVVLPRGVQCNSSCQSGITWTQPQGAPVSVTAFGGDNINGATYTNPDTTGTVTIANEETLLIIKAPTGTLSVGQPPLLLTIPATFTSDAVLGTNYTINGRGIFVLGALPNGTRGACGSGANTICQSFTGTVTTPVALKSRKEVINLNDGSTATGPNYPRRFNIYGDISTSRTVSNISITDTIPDEIVVLNPPASNCSGLSIIPSPTTCTFTFDPNGGGSFTATYSSITGAAGNDILISYDAYVQRDVDNLSPSIISPTTGSQTTSQNSVSINYFFDPDGAGPLTSIAQPVQTSNATIIQRSIFSKKEATVSGDISPSGNSPGDTITHTIKVYVSDYFDFNNLQIHDDILDGQTYVPGSFSIRLNEGPVNQTISGDSNFTVPGYLSIGSKNLTTGITSFDLDLSAVIDDPTLFNGDDSLTGADAFSGAGASYIYVTYQTIIDEEYTEILSGGKTRPIDSNDQISNQFDLDSTIVGTSNHQTYTDVTATVTIQPLTTVTKVTQFKNGGAPSTTISPGDNITYKIRGVVPTGDVEDLVYTDFLPTPLFDSLDPAANSTNLLFSANQDPQGDTAPLPGHWRFTSASTLTPAVTLTQNGNDNSIRFNFADNIENNTSSSMQIIELLFTVTATNEPMDDQLELVNLLFVDYSNSASSTSVASVTAFQDLIVNNPDITVLKTASSLISSNGSISSGNFTGVDAGDILEYSVSLQNTGSLRAYDVDLNDIIPTGLLRPGTGYNLSIVDSLGGSNCDLTSLVDSSDATRVRLSGISINPNGVCLVTYRLEVASSVVTSDLITNTATSTFASAPGGTKFSPVSESATTLIGSPQITKTYVTGTSDFSETTDPQLAVGESVRFLMNVCVPEGSSNTFRVEEVEPTTNQFDPLTSTDVDFPSGSVVACTHNAALFAFAGVPDVCFSLNPSLAANQSTVSTTNYRINFGTLTNFNRDNSTQECFDVRFRVRVISSHSGGTFSNRGRVTWVNTLGTSSNAFENESYQVIRPTIAITKTTTTPQPISIGQTVNYRLTVTNTGTSPAYDINVVDALPVGLGTASFVSATYNASDISSSVGLSQVGQNLSFTFQNTSGNQDVEVGATLIINFSVPVSGVMVADSTVGLGHPGGITDTPGCVNSLTNTGDVSSFLTGDGGLGSTISNITDSTVARTLDSDGDTVPNSVEGCSDADGDGVANYLDTDSDDNGVGDSTEYNGGSNYDGDSALDFIDLDDDGDGINDIIEGSSSLADDDGDGIQNYRDLDSDNDGITDLTEGSGDFDGDGIPNYLDLDSDNDGIQDILEAGGVDSDNNGRADVLTDTDNDGLVNTYDTSNGGTAIGSIDTDSDSRRDYLDLDSDGDGILDIIEAGGTDSDQNGRVDSYTDTNSNGWHDPIDGNAGGTRLPLPNTDGTAGPNFQDTDSDGDGIRDRIEGQPNSGVRAASGTDSDGDGIDNNFDINSGNQPVGNIDSDGDGILDHLDLDSDNDGIPDATEGDETANVDGDSVPNYRDIDADNDGIPDVIEFGSTDVDNNGRFDCVSSSVGSNGLCDLIDPSVGGVALVIINSDLDSRPDYLDLDSDNDGMADIYEAGGVDVDNNGVDDSSSDTNSNGWLASYDPTEGGVVHSLVNTDGDLVPNYRDTDSDGDGILDFAEAIIPNLGQVGFISPSGLDSDSDGIDNSYDTTNSNAFSNVLADTDGDGVLDHRDLDSDSDGIPDQTEGDHTEDMDSDLYPNYRDLDSDGDTIFDIIEGGGGSLDGNNDGVIDTLLDTDGDGLADLIDLDNSGTPLLVPNTDGTGGANFLDLDSDGDGISDEDETTSDKDGDLTPNYVDPDSDSDGIPDSVELDIDTDGDGLPNYLDLDSDNDGIPDATELDIDTDRDGIDNYLDLDSDNDGISDLIESGGADTNNNGVLDSTTDTDNDGLIDIADPSIVGSIYDFSSPVDFDADSFPNYLDIDADNDGIVDNIEAQGETGYIAPSGLDSDGDGIDNSYDTNSGGSLINIPTNTDLDANPDYLDLDSDSDNVPDRIEGHDQDMDGIADNISSGVDSDNDGLDDAFDNLNYVGSNWAQNVVGSNSPLQNTDSDAIRDWRDTDDDGDSIPTAVEDFNNNTDYSDDDFDNDGTPNYLEPNATDDRDADGIPDADEITIGTDPCDPDTDDDNLLDGEEIINGLDGYITNPLDADSDDDGLSDGNEYLRRTNPLLVDSDSDTISDGVEVGNTTLIAGGVSQCTGIPYDGTDSAIFIPDQCPANTPTDPLDLDSDDDGRNDGSEDLNQDGCVDTGETNPTSGLEACNNFSQSTNQFKLDGSAHAINKLVNDALKIRQKGGSCKRLSKKAADKIKRDARTVTNDLWEISWLKVPSYHFVCSPVPTELCTVVDTDQIAADVRADVAKLNSYVLKALGQCKKNKSGVRIRSSARYHSTVIDNTLKALPYDYLVCNP